MVSNQTGGFKLSWSSVSFLYKKSKWALVIRDMIFDNLMTKKKYRNIGKMQLLDYGYRSTNSDIR